MPGLRNGCGTSLSDGRSVAVYEYDDGRTEVVISAPDGQSGVRIDIGPDSAFAKPMTPGWHLFAAHYGESPEVPTDDLH